MAGDNITNSTAFNQTPPQTLTTPSYDSRKLLNLLI